MDSAPPVNQPISSGIAAAAASQPPRNDGQSVSSSPPGLPRPDVTSGLAMTGGPAGHPEVEAGKQGLGVEAGKETGEIEVIPESPEISPELAEHVEKVVRGEIQLPGPIQAGKHEGEDVTISPFTPQQPNIVLPLSQLDFQLGAKQPTSSAWLWLVEWIKRIILKNPGRAVYRT